MSDDNIITGDRPMAAMEPSARDGYYSSAPENMLKDGKN